MASRTLKRWTIGIIVLIVVLVIAGVAGMHFAARSLKQHVLEALGPESEVADLTVGFTSINISGVRVKAPKGWPADSTLRAEHIVLVPDLKQLLSRRIYIKNIRIENAYISAVRPKEGGGLKVLPSMLDKKRDPESERRSGQIHTVEFSNCVIELFDMTLAGHQKMRVDAVRGTLQDLNLPKLDSHSKVDLHGVIKGAAHQGTIGVTGWIDVAAKSSELSTQVRNVDLVLFQPYVIQKTKAGIDEGTFNLDLKATVRNNVLNAPGTLTLTGLKVKNAETPLGGLKTVPERAVIGALADKDDRITVHFDLKGNLDNPAFSLTEGLGLRTGTALLKGLGLGFEALIRAFFILVRGFVPH